MLTDDVRGRVMGVYMLTWGLMPIGALPMGVFASWIGAPATVAAFAGLSSLVIVLLAMSVAALRHGLSLERPQRPPFIMSGMLLGGLTLACAYPVFAATCGPLPTREDPRPARFDPTAK